MSSENKKNEVIIMNKMINNLGNTMITQMRVVNLYGLSGNKLSNELYGMTQVIKAMGIELEFDFNNEVTEYTAVTLNGITFNV